MLKSASTTDRAYRVRAFNRFYTNRIGLLEEHLPGAALSLTQVRVLYEVGHGAAATGQELSKILRLNPGYLSRVLAGLRKRGLIVGSPSAIDRRQTDLSLSDKGHEMLDALRLASQSQIEDMLAPLSDAAQEQLVDAMRIIQGSLTQGSLTQGSLTQGSMGEGNLSPSFRLRPHRIGDIGHVIRRHGMLYAEEYGWDGTFEAMVARIGADFLDTFNPSEACCWIAEQDGEIVGSAFVMRQTEMIAKLRMVYVEPSARGLGIGKRLLEECLRFSRSAKYKKMTLWTNANLHAATTLYRSAGFQLVTEEPHHSFGKSLIGQNWELDL